MDGLSKLFMYIPGIILFLVGSGQVRRWLRTYRADSVIDATVVGCKHVVKKDKKEREIYNYYDVTVEYRNSQTMHQERLAIKSPTEYAEAQQVKMYREKGSNAPGLAEDDEFMFHPWVTMIGGALLIVLALEQNRGREIPAMICLALIMIGAGVNLLVNYMVVKRRDLQPVDGRVTDVYVRQLSKETKLLKGARYTYYPVVRYELDGKENIRRCNMNSSGKNTFKIGDHFVLYFDREKKIVIEKKESLGSAVVGVILLLIGLLAGASIFSVII